MKTVMQEHISHMKKIQEMVKLQNVDKDLEETILESIEGCIRNAESSLEAEKEQMVKFAFDFYYDMSHQSKVPENYITENREHAEIYFDNTFNPTPHQ